MGDIIRGFLFAKREEGLAVDVIFCFLRKKRAEKDFGSTFPFAGSPKLLEDKENMIRRRVFWWRKGEVPIEGRMVSLVWGLVIRCFVSGGRNALNFEIYEY